VLQRAHVPGFHPRALVVRVPVSVACRGAAVADAGHDQWSSGGRHFAARHSELSRPFAGIHDQIIVVVGRDGVPTAEGHLVMPVPDKIAMENVNSPGRVVADKYHAMLAVFPVSANWSLHHCFNHNLKEK
jgi:hypothetical protein